MIWFKSSFWRLASKVWKSWFCELFGGAVRGIGTSKVQTTLLSLTGENRTSPKLFRSWLWIQISSFCPLKTSLHCFSCWIANLPNGILPFKWKSLLLENMLKGRKGLFFSYLWTCAFFLIIKTFSTFSNILKNLHHVH